MYRNIELLYLCTWNQHGTVGQLCFNKTEKKVEHAVGFNNEEITSALSGSCLGGDGHPSAEAGVKTEDEVFSGFYIIRKKTVEKETINEPGETGDC